MLGKNKMIDLTKIVKISFIADLSSLNDDCPHIRKAFPSVCLTVEKFKIQVKSN